VCRCNRNTTLSIFENSRFKRFNQDWGSCQWHVLVYRTRNKRFLCSLALNDHEGHIVGRPWQGFLEWRLYHSILLNESYWRYIGDIGNTGCCQAVAHYCYRSRHRRRQWDYERSQLGLEESKSSNDQKKEKEQMVVEVVKGEKGVKMNQMVLQMEENLSIVVDNYLALVSCG